jgi:uncharacterized membrane protein (UPF0182 family)
MRSGRPPGGFYEEDEPIFVREPLRPLALRLDGRWSGPLAIGALILLALLFVGPAIGLYGDALWFDRLGYGSVFRTRLRAQAVSFLAFGVVFFLFALANALPALGFRGRRRLLTTIGVRQRVLWTPLAGVTLTAVFLLSLLFGRIGAAQWDTTLRFLHQVPFGRSDPVWHRDLSFYLFSLPFFRFAWGWLLAMVVVVGAGVVLLYLSHSGFQDLTLSRIALRHVSLLAALFFGLMAAHYFLSLQEVVLGKRSVVWGAGFTDLNARVPALGFMVVLMLVLSGFMFFNAVLREQWPLAVSAVAWIAAILLVTVLIPSAVQRFVVQPSELTRERPYLEREIAATREAYGLDQIEEIKATVDQQVTAALVSEHRQTIESARLWDPRYLPATYNQVQALRQYYEFKDIAVDRYTLNGQVRQLELSARELNPQKGFQPTWVNQRLKLTHGYGAVASLVNVADRGGLPELVLRDLPPTGELKVDRPAIYFSRSPSDYVIVDSKEQEFDYPSGEVNISTRWEGKTGVLLSGPLRRLVFALRLGDLNILLSPLITSESQLLFHRRIEDRAQTLAPFFALDSDPYLVIADGKLYWMMDGYARSDSYPYSERLANRDRTVSFNYLRNSIKIVVDAYDGSTSFYRIDMQDPVAATYDRIFPGLLKPIDSMPAALRPHLRYPQDLLRIQAEIFRRYHMQDPQAFYNREDLWDIANEHVTQTTRAPIDPYYVVLKLPGQTSEEFLLMLPFTVSNKTNMSAYMAARSDGANYGKLVVFRYSKDELIIGPEQVEASIRGDSVIQAQVFPLSSQGSSVILGNLLVLPIGRALLFVEPLYTKSETSQFPQLRKVIVADGTRAAMADTLDKALEALIGSPISTPDQKPAPGGPAPPPATLAALLQDAVTRYARAQDLLRQGDLGGYQREIDEVGRLLREAQRLTGAAPSPSPGGSPTPSPTRR